MLQILLLYSLCLKGDHRVPRGFQDIVWLGQDCQVVKGCRGVSRKFQESFLSVSNKFHVAWHSLQLPEQREGLFFWWNFTLIRTNFFLRSWFSFITIS